MNKTYQISYAGLWKPIALDKNLQKGIDTVFYVSLVQLKDNPGYGIILSGWAYSGWDAQTKDTVDVSIALFAKNSVTGKFEDVTTAYIKDSLTNGNGGAIVYDFNRDNLADIFLAAHNESPKLAMPSTAYISNGTGKFDKVTVDDNVMAHSVDLSIIDGEPQIVVSTFRYDDSSRRSLPIDLWPIYSYNNGTFEKKNIDPQFNAFNIISSTVSSFTNDGRYQLVMGDQGPKRTIEVYELVNGVYDEKKLVQEITPYLSTLSQYKNYPSMYGAGYTHTYKIISEDVNSDGYEDLLALQNMWSPDRTDFPSALQILVNNQNGVFRDKTPELNPEMSLDTDEIPRDLLSLDIDGSGIKSYLLGRLTWDGANRQANYILLNDGTGRLYVALHNEFNELASEVYSYAKTIKLDSQSFYINPYSTSAPVPNFFAIPQSNGSLNYLAILPTIIRENGQSVAQKGYFLFDIPLNYNPTTDYSTNVSIPDRNQSKIIRTWAGNDTIFDVNANSALSTVNGGLGTDTAVYSEPKGRYSITPLPNNSIEVKGSNTFDRLTNIERLKFSDSSLAVDTSGNSGQAYRVYKAAFNRDPMQGDAKGLGYWIAQIDKGMDLIEVSARFVDSNEFRSLYGTNPTNEQFLTKLYTNVLGRQPEASGFNWWLNELNTNPEKTKAKVLADFAESAENQTGVVSLIGNGITYEPWIG